MGLLSLICGGSWWFVMFRGGSWCFGMFRGGLWWFMVVCDVSWWFVMVCGVSWWFLMFHGGSWCFVVVRDGSWWFFSTILKKISCDPLFNQSESKIQYQISFWMRLRDGSWCFVMVRGGSWWFVVVRDGLWWFVVVRDDSWWFVVVHDVFFSRERSCDPLFNQSESQIHYQLSFWMRLRDGSWWFIRDGFVVVRDVSWWFVVVHDDSWWFVMVRDGSWWFVVVRGGSWWFVMFFSLEKGHVTLFSTNQRPKFTMKSHFWWDFVFAPFHLKRIPLKSSAKNQLTTRNGFCCLCLFWGSGTWWIHSSLSFSSFWIK